MTNRSNSWTVEDDELLRELWEADAEIPEIAEALGRSKNAVTSRATDLGLSRRRPSMPWTRTEMNTLRKLFERGLSDAEIAAKLDDRTIEAVKRQRSNMGLIRRHPHENPARPMLVVGPARTCQWIEGDPKRPGYSFCGRPSVDGKSYCGEHLRRAYIQPGAPRRPKKVWRDPLRASGRI